MTDENTESTESAYYEDPNAAPEAADPAAPEVPEVADLQDQILGLHGRIDGIETGLSQILAVISKDAGAPPAEVPIDPTLADLPEGTTRFFCVTSSEFQISLKKKTFVTTGEGVHEPVPERFLQFQNHIATVDGSTPEGEEIVRLARAYIEKMGTRSEFHEDRQAQPVTRVQVSEGARSTPVRQPDPSPQAALAARL